MNDWITWVIQGAIGLMVGALAWFWKQDRKTISKQVAAQDQRLSHLEKKFEQLPFVYTTREDFIRSMTTVEQKLDKIIDRLPPKE